MDVLSHGLLGRLFARVDVEGWFGPGRMAAFVLGALAPDIDLICVVAGWDRYLAVHEVGTHTLAATPLVAAAVALTVRAFNRRARLGRLWVAAGLSVLVGHLVLDLVSGSDMRLLVPLSRTRFGPHWLAMADLLAIGLLVGGTVWSRWRPRLAAGTTIAALALLVAVKAQSQAMATVAFDAAAGASSSSVPAVHPEPVNGSLVAWTFYERRDRWLRAWRVDARVDGRSLQFEREIDVEAEQVAAGVEVPAIATFLGLAHLPFPRLEDVDGRRALFWSDLRDCDESRCVMSFGAEIDREGRAVSEIIRIGPPNGFVQRRPAR